MLKFFYNAAPNPMKIALLLEEIGLPYEPIPVDTRKGEQFEAGFLAVNPNAKVPVIVDGATTVFDSNAILLYLADREKAFVPQDLTSAERGQMLSWLMFIATGIGPFSGQSVHFRHVAPEPKEYALNRYDYEAHRHWKIIESHLSQHHYFLGDSYSIVDMAFWGWARLLPYCQKGAFIMYPGSYAIKHPDRAAFIMASSGEAVSYAAFERRSNQLAHLLRDQGLKRLDHYAIFMENNDRYLESCAAGERSGLYYTCVNSFLKADELAYILQNSQSQALITSYDKLDLAVQALEQCPLVRTLLVCGPQSEPLPRIAGVRSEDFAQACQLYPDSPIADESLGTPMLYSSGTTGRPKGILRPLPDQAPSKPLPLFDFLFKLWRYREDMMVLSPAPLYHAAPQAAVSLTIRAGGTVVIMEKFDPLQYLSLVEQYKISHSQLVPTMFSRMLKLSDEQRHAFDLSSLEVAIHAAAPCPPQVKEAMIDWWGPIIHEYYGATEGLGFTACDTEQWLAHRGTVGKVLFGDLHILDEAMQVCPTGQPGTVWFKTGSPFEYFNDPEKTREATSADGTMTTVGDVGYVDNDGFLYLTDRSSFMIICGGVNIYPQECENLLITHPWVEDAAVFGVPNPDLGEEVKAVVQLMPGTEPSKAVEAELIAFCRATLAIQKCPRSIDFEASLPRLPTGKLYKRVLRDRYWSNQASRII